MRERERKREREGERDASEGVCADSAPSRYIYVNISDLLSIPLKLKRERAFRPVALGQQGALGRCPSVKYSLEYICQLLINYYHYKLNPKKYIAFNLV